MKKYKALKKSDKAYNGIKGRYYTNTITCNKTLASGEVVNVLEDNAEFAKDEVDNIRLS